MAEIQVGMFTPLGPVKLDLPSNTEDPGFSAVKFSVDNADAAAALPAGSLALLGVGK